LLQAWINGPFTDRADIRDRRIGRMRRGMLLPLADQTVAGSRSIAGDRFVAGIVDQQRTAAGQ
jgi:hypothetical protein